MTEAELDVELKKLGPLARAKLGAYTALGIVMISKSPQEIKRDAIREIIDVLAESYKYQTLITVTKAIAKAMESQNAGQAVSMVAETCLKLIEYAEEANKNGKKHCDILSNLIEG